MLLPNNQRQHRTLHVQKDVLPYALCEILCPVSAALASLSRMDSISTSYFVPGNHTRVSSGEPFKSNENAIVNDSPALINFTSGLINRSTISMNELEFITSQIKCLPGFVHATCECWNTLLLFHRTCYLNNFPKVNSPTTPST